MFSHLSSLARAGVIALTAVASLTPAASGAPLGPVVDRSLAKDGPDKPILVWGGELRPGTGRVWPRGRWGGGGWGGGGHWRHGGGGWGHGGHWHGGGWGGWGSGFALGLGFGVPLGYYGGGYYDNYVPYRPRYYAPRAYYRGGSAHEQWCYSRYRSYRAWDNSFQPYNGPRQLCYSPYS